MLTSGKEWVHIAEVNPPTLPDMRHLLLEGATGGGQTVDACPRALRWRADTRSRDASSCVAPLRDPVL